MADKQGSGWFPTRKSRSVCYSRGGPTYPFPGESRGSEAEDDTTDVFRFLEAEIIEESPEEESDSDSDEETSSGENEGLTAEERLGGRTLGQLAENDVIRRVLQLVVRKGFMVFPYHEERQYVNEDKLCDLYDEIRQAASSLPAVPGSTNYARIVQERPPVGSHFTRRGGYTTPEGVVVCHTLRNKVKDLRDKFAAEARLQRERAGIRFQIPTMLTRSSLYQQDRAAQPLIEREYAPAERPPTPSPSPRQTRVTSRSHQRELNSQPQDAGN